jgi:pimeloyl-ACP methyl ester carboxylesterase
VQERPFEVTVGDGLLQGHLGGNGTPALVLHGGPGLPDYLGPCAGEIGDLFTTIRYTQRGTPPSTVDGPYTIETHMADALTVLDALELERAWAIGHSWGGHLALHLAVAHPDRLRGIVCIGTLGASDEVLPEFRENLMRPLSEEERDRVDDIDRRGDEGTASEEELLEMLAILWPHYFADPAGAPPLEIEHQSVDCTKDTFESIKHHFGQGTLATGLTGVCNLPALFAHGIQDPLPLRASVDTAKLVPGAKVGRIAGCGHFPWLERPGFLNRMLRGLIAQL